MELSSLNVSSLSNQKKTRKLNAQKLCLEKTGKPPLLILEDLGELKEDDDFVDINSVEQKLHEKFVQANLTKKYEEIQELKKKLANKKNTYSNTKYIFGPKSEIGKIETDIKEKEEKLEDEVNNIVMSELGKGKRKHKKRTKKRTKKTQKKKT